MATRRISFKAIKQEMKATSKKANQALRRTDVSPKAKVKLRRAVAALERLGRTKPWRCFQPMFINF